MSETTEKKFVYVKAYSQEKLANGETPKLDVPKFRDNYSKENVTFEKSKINGIVADVSFSENYNKDGHDVSALLITENNYLKVTFPCERVLGTQFLKRITAVDLKRKVVLELWKNSAGYGNLNLYQRSETVEDGRGFMKKEFVKDAFKEDKKLPEVVTHKVGKQEVRDYSERTDYLMEAVNKWKDGNKQLTTNLKSMTMPEKDNGNDDE